MFERLATRTWRDRLRGATTLGLVAALLLVAFGRVWHRHDHEAGAGLEHAACAGHGHDHAHGHSVGHDCHDESPADEGESTSRTFVSHAHDHDCALCEILRDASRPGTLGVRARIEVHAIVGVWLAEGIERGPQRLVIRAIARGPPTA